MMVDDMAQDERIIKNDSFDDELSFSHWVFNPDMPSPYNDFLGKDLVLGNIKKESHFNRITNNLRLAVYLSKFKKPKIIGFDFYVDDEEEPIRVDESNKSKAFDIISSLRPGGLIKRITVIRANGSVYNKSVHNFLSKAYVLSQSARAIDGMSLKHINTRYDITNKTLKEEANRSSFFAKNNKKWSEYEKQKNW